MIQPAAGSESLSHVLDKLAQVLNERRVAYALIGGLGVSMRGSMRTTQDVDLLINIPQLQLPGVFEALAAAGFQIDVLEAIRVWNRDGLLDFNSGAIRVDWLKPVVPAFGRILERAKAEQVGDQMIRVADAEGLILMKLIAFRNRDQDDIKSILAANPASL
ncbi:MAG TPA: hypothetical protein VE988_18850, partial [Gemmataceae bacterium]|nr:hypothetical protein [Gemmataceae bacterium]